MKSSLVASSLAVAALCTATTAKAADVWAGLDIKTAYTATGATCNDGMVAQPCVDIYGLKVGDLELPLTLEFWGNIDLEKYDGDEVSKAGRFQEVDLAAYLNLGGYIDENLTLDVGYVEYDYPRHDWETDHLIHVKAKYKVALGDNLGAVTPCVQAKYRFAGDSKGKCEMAAELAYGVTLAKDVVSDGWDLGFGLSADIWYVSCDGMDRDEEGNKPDSGFACSYLTAKLSLAHFYVGYQHIFQIDDDVLSDEAYDVEDVGIFGIDYDF